MCMNCDPRLSDAERYELAWNALAESEMELFHLKDRVEELETAIVNVAEPWASGSCFSCGNSSNNGDGHAEDCLYSKLKIGSEPADA